MFTANTGIGILGSTAAAFMPDVWIVDFCCLFFLILLFLLDLCMHSWRFGGQFADHGAVWDPVWVRNFLCWWDQSLRTRCHGGALLFFLSSLLTCFVAPVIIDLFFLDSYSFRIYGETSSRNRGQTMLVPPSFFPFYCCFLMLLITNSTELAPYMIDIFVTCLALRRGSWTQTHRLINVLQCIF